jgi:hypothetical protein
MVPNFFSLTVYSEEIATLNALFKVCRKRDDLRARLGDTERMYWLGRELSRGMLRPPAPPAGGLRRDTTDVLTAMRALGFKHEYERPLAGAPLPFLEDVVAKTQARLEASPYRRGRSPIDDDRVAEIVRRAYLDVDPWPFRALVADDFEAPDDDFLGAP